MKRPPPRPREFTYGSEKPREPWFDEGETPEEKASYAVKTLRKMVVEAITETTSAKERHMRFIGGLSWRVAKIIWTKLAPKTAQK